MKRMSNEQKALARRMCLTAQRLRENKTRERPSLLSIRIHSVLLQIDRMLGKQAYSRGFCVDGVSSANPAPQTCFKESCYLCRAFDVGIDQAAVGEKKKGRGGGLAFSSGSHRIDNSKNMHSHHVALCFSYDSCATISEVDAIRSKRASQIIRPEDRSQCVSFRSCCRIQIKHQQSERGINVLKVTALSWKLKETVTFGVMFLSVFINSA